MPLVPFVTELAVGPIDGVNTTFQTSTDALAFAGTLK
jgi:hypothetical protein